MPKTIALHVMALLLSLSVVTPSVAFLIDADNDMVFFLDTGEEDKGSNDPGEEMDKKELFMAWHLQKLQNIDSDTSVSSVCRVLKVQNSNRQVALQPPEI